MALAEMGEREGVLRQYRVSEWWRLPAGVLRERPLMLLVIDELLALAMLLTPAEQKAFWGLLAAFASRARKVGMSSVALATDPTYRALGQGGLNYRSQCGRVSFRMIQAAGSRAILDEKGAEALSDGAFMALLDRPGVVTGMAANPSDDELRNYLRQQPATPLAQPLWLPATTGHNHPTTGHNHLTTGHNHPTTGHNQFTTDIQPPIIQLTTSYNRSQPPNNHLQPAHNHSQPAQLVVQPVATGCNQPQPPILSQPQPVATTLPLSATRPPTPAERRYIRQLYGEMGSKNGVCRQVYGFKDGKVYGWVSAAIEER
jgi:hypothetical protein